jgi:hypothetical protein
MAWLVKGWVVERNGHPINWAKATVSIAKEKAQHLNMNPLMQANKVERIEISEGSNRSHGALAIGQTSSKPKKDCSPIGNCKRE